MYRYVAIWHGGPNYSEPSWASDVFAVQSIEHARSVLRVSAMRRGYFQSVQSVRWDDNDRPWCPTGHVEGADTPAVEAGACVILAPMASAVLRDLETDMFGGGASHVITLGPHGGISVRRV